jgi:dTDP-glucose pyrophosphorylase
MNNKPIKLIPMAGAGSRFAEKGYTDPKPLLPVMGLPMVVSAAKALPGSDENMIFVLRDFHISDYGIDKTLKEHFPDAKIIVIDKLTEGQASTCLLAKEFINNDQELFIGASDNGMLYDEQKFEEAKKDADALVFTFRNNPTVLPNPKAYGWVEVEEDDKTIIEAKVKFNMPDPLHKHAYVGAFWFKTGKLFVEAAERMIAQNRRINNEFYVDECINDVIQMGYKAKVFEVDHYICWGTPNDYKTFQYWEEYYKKIKP